MILMVVGSAQGDISNESIFFWMICDFQQFAIFIQMSECPFFPSDLVLCALMIAMNDCTKLYICVKFPNQFHIPTKPLKKMWYIL